MNTKAEQFFGVLKQAVENDELMLPTLPEVALKIRETVEDDNASAHQIADVLLQDASLSARLMQAANSPMYRGNSKVEDVQTAIMRMGMRVVCDMVVRLAMKQMFQATSDALDEHFRRTWNTAIEVAAISRMLATTVKGVNPEQALLAGLVHNIGALPILVLAENDEELFNNSKELGALMDALQDDVGAMIMEKWNFTEDMTEVVTKARDFNYSHEGDANLVDIVQVSLLQGHFIADDQVPSDWNAVPAFSQLAMDCEVNVVEMEENQEAIEITRQALSI